jgi:hypothetical protein
MFSAQRVSLYYLTENDKYLLRLDFEQDPGTKRPLTEH